MNDETVIKKAYKLYSDKDSKWALNKCEEKVD